MSASTVVAIETAASSRQAGRQAPGQPALAHQRSPLSFVLLLLRFCLFRCRPLPFRPPFQPRSDRRTASRCFPVHVPRATTAVFGSPGITHSLVPQRPGDTREGDGAGGFRRSVATLRPKVCFVPVREKGREGGRLVLCSPLQSI